ncbi:hypothetical protein EAF04_007069 [Stromatinia cepivora]|nr:hypothetical protein EAF04_007069 [Stromatinia cepivora]
MEGVDSHVPGGESNLHSEAILMENDAADRRPCCFRRVFNRLFRGAAKKTLPYHNIKDFAQFATERENLRQQIDNVTQEREQAKREIENTMKHIENITRERNELKTKCENLQNDFSIVCGRRDSHEADAKKVFENLHATKNLLEAQKDETRKLASKYNKAVKDKISQDQEYQELLEKFEIQKKENFTLNEELKEFEIRRISAAEVIILQQKLEASEQQMQHYERLAARFRTFVHISNTPTEIDDTVIASEFEELRHQIEQIIHTYYSMSKAPSTREHVTLRNAQMHLCRIFEADPDEYGLQARVRAFVFRYLDKSLLFKRFFGLEDKSLGMEKGLRNFESMLSKNHPDRHAEIADWRTVTMKCAQYLQPANPSHPPRICMDVAEEFMWLLDPLRKDPNKKTDQLRGQWQELCMNAFKLTMKLRTYKDVYRCEIPAWGEVLHEDEVEPQAEVYTENCKKKTELNDWWVIAYSIAGTLVKYPAEEPEKRVVVVKPCVAVQAHPDD